MKYIESAKYLRTDDVTAVTSRSRQSCCRVASSRWGAPRQRFAHVSPGTNSLGHARVNYVYVVVNSDRHVRGDRGELGSLRAVEDRGRRQHVRLLAAVMGV